MLPIDGQPILTAAQMRAAEERAAPTPDAMYGLMERAGAGVAEAVRRLAAGAEVLILCGPGNNGGDGYVAARVLRAAGHPVRVAALGESVTDLARRARAAWDGPVEAFPAALPDEAAYAPVVVDAVFGTDLSRPLANDAMAAIGALVAYAHLSVAVDLPSGIDADTGAEINRLQIPEFDLTLALGALKPAHVLQPAAEQCGAVRLIDIGLGLDEIGSPRDNVSPDQAMAAPWLHAPYSWNHKYSRGMAVVIAGAMPGAAALAIEAAMRAGAGYGLLLAEDAPGLPHAVVRRPWSADALAEAVDGKPKVVIVIGPGLGRGADALAKLDAAIACDCSLVIDGDALHLLEERHLALFRERTGVAPDRRVVLTPHAGEFAALFGKPSGSKIEAARQAARRAGATVVYKGPDTVVAHPNGHTNTARLGSTWLSTAGTGDVLAGTIAGTWHAATPFGGVEAAVWLHAEAARRCGASFIADDLAHALTAARASLCR
ncbi:NAD(P)H-hydrate epimerase [Sphingomonas sp.]|uniref:NAD(P)H-hydrate epimerase n=1 Tax=Sphingomonas sp. TaxID=28214 RepID=UPI003B00C9AE